MSVRNEKYRKPLRHLIFSGVPWFFCRELEESVSIETAPIHVVLLNNILTEKFNFAVMDYYAVEYQRIRKNSRPTWYFPTIKIQACMQKSVKMFTFGSSSINLRFDCDFERINETHTYGEKGVCKKE